MSEKDNMYTPKQVLERYISGCVGRTAAPWWRICLLGVMAGAFIAFGAAASSVSMYGIPATGLARTLGGAVFPIGLMLIILVGGELFTGDCLMIMGAMDRRYSWTAVLRSLVLVFVSNFVGGLLVAFLVTNSGQFGFSDNALGAYVIKVASGKLNLSFGTAFVSGILCNILVCAAVFMAAGASDVAGKLWATFFPIFVFVICGFEHCVANMYYLTAGILAAGNKAYAAKAAELYGAELVEQLADRGWLDMLTKNLLPVTLGNMVGGMLCVGVPVYILYRNKESRERK